MFDDGFSGFMPVINKFYISPETNSISSEGDLVSIHVIKIVTADNNEYIFSITPDVLSKLYFLILKSLSS